MFDEFRNQVDDTSFLDDSDSDSGFTESIAETQPSRVLGMTPVQRFVIAFMIFGISCLLSMLCLLVSGKIALPV